MYNPLVLLFNRYTLRCCHVHYCLLIGRFDRTLGGLEMEMRLRDVLAKRFQVCL